MRYVNEEGAPLEREEVARERVRVRVLRGIAADRWRRRRRASIALAFGAATSSLVTILLLVV